MARRHDRTPSGVPPETLRFDLRVTGAHPLLREWAFRRPFIAGQAIRNALEGVLQREGEQGLDRILRELEGKPAAKVRVNQEPAVESIATAPATAKQEGLAAQGTGPAAPEVSAAAPEVARPAPEVSATAPEVAGVAHSGDFIPEHVGVTAPAAEEKPVALAAAVAPAEALTSLAADVLRETRSRNAAALLGNENLFGVPTKG